jgi:N6-adenosine-specific RNA methylase IME4
MNALELRDNAKQQLAEIKTIESGVEYLNKVKAIEVWAKAEKKDAELQNLVAEQKLRTQRILGGLLKENPVVKHRPSKVSKSTTLNDYNITRDESSAFQRISSLPQEIFEEEIAKQETNKRIELTTSRMLQAVKDYQKEDKKNEWQEKVNKEPQTNYFIDIFKTDKKFRVIYADPAWSYNDKQDTTQLGGAAKHYDTMSTSNICSLPVNNILEKDSVLFLWVTSPLLEDGLRVIMEWGFKYKTSFIWDKVKHNMGHYNSVRHEFLLVATKGSCTPDNIQLYDSVQSIERNNNHSEKPIEFMNIIDDLYNYGDKIELFSRKIKKDNWYGWGNEL